MAFNVGDLFAKGSIAEQLVVWDVLGQLAQPLLAPMLQTIASEVFQLDPNVPVSADVLARLVARGLLDEADGINEAGKTGIGEPQFRKLVADASHAPDLAAVISGYHRGLIPADSATPDQPSLSGALLDAGLRPDWVPIVRELALQIPSASDYLNAYLQGQISEADARAGWAVNGMRPDDFGWMFDANGTAPTPDMLGTMANRGIVPWDGDGPESVSFHQGFLEGPWRNKWAAPMRQLMQYLIPPRSVTAMVRAGALTDARAIALYKAAGMDPADAAAMLAEAHHSRSAAAKDLSEAQVIALYKQHKITDAKAVQLLQGLKYSAENAQLLVSLANVAKADAHLTAATNKVHSRYVAHKISLEAAKSALNELHYPPDQAAELLALWELERGVNVAQLTEPQIVTAWGYGVIDQPTAVAELAAIGYTAWDAWLLLSNKNKGPLPDEPAKTTGVGQLP